MLATPPVCETTPIRKGGWSIRKGGWSIRNGVWSCWGVTRCKLTHTPRGLTDKQYQLYILPYILFSSITSSHCVPLDETVNGIPVGGCSASQPTRGSPAFASTFAHTRCMRCSDNAPQVVYLMVNHRELGELHEAHDVLTLRVHTDHCL